MKKIFLIILIPFLLSAQSRWKRSSEEIMITSDLFHSTHSANLPTTQNLNKNDYLFEISHRFGPVDGGYDTMFGLDGPVNMRLSLGYGIRDDLMITLGRSNVLANLDIAVKYKLIDFDHASFPSALAVNAGAGIINRNENAEIKMFDANYMQYFVQLVYNVMFFDKKLGVGIVPSYVYNSYVFAVSENIDKKSTITLATYYQYYFNRMWSLWLEYSPVLSGHKGRIINNTNSEFENLTTSAIGVALETGGHIFNVFITNNSRINTAQYLIGDYGFTGKKSWRFAFGITRIL